MPGRSQRLAQGGHDQPACKAGFAEPDLGLGGVHVDIHLRRFDVDEQHRCRVPVTAEEIGIGGPQGAV